jgi:hypothetical protein
MEANASSKSLSVNNKKMEKITSYKGFNSDLTCRDFKYKVGEEYEQKGEIIPCANGFHACENPFDVFDYYDSIRNNRYCEVEQSGVIVKERNKTASSHIKIKAEIGFIGLFKAGIEWLKEVTNPVKTITKVKDAPKTTNDNGAYEVQICSSEGYAQIGSNGNFVCIGSSGVCDKIGSSGKCAEIGSSEGFAQICSSGDYAKIGSSGDSAKMGSSGDYAKIGSSGYNAQIGSSGKYAEIGSSGDNVKMGSSGDYALIGSSGYNAQIGSSGNSAKIGSSGGYAQIGSSGDFTQICSSGGSAKIGSSGSFAQIESTGEGSVICCAGNQSKVKAKKGSWITLSEWGYNKDKNAIFPKCVKTEYVDGERIKEDTWYTLIDGKFVEFKC